ncbi:MAG: HIT family protein [Gammaproteobacteria bacterium]|nr:HIT family protein [Gammaproteobacteria bacterium]
MAEKKFDLNDPCIFCNPREEEILGENEYAQIIKDNSPVSEGHCLIIPKRHIKTYFEATEAENAAFFELIKEAKTNILKNGNQPDGFNIGCNNDVAAGQSVFHLHIHVIPRYLGDVENPKGGIRHVIPKNASYNVIPR